MTEPSSTPPPPAPPFASPPQGEDRTVAILAYLTLIGFIIAIVLHGNKKTKLGTYHLRQALGLILCSLVCLIPLLGLVVLVFLFVLWIFGLIAAVNGQMKPVPVLGEQFQKWFSSAFE